VTTPQPTPSGPTPAPSGPAPSGAQALRSDAGILAPVAAQGKGSKYGLGTLSGSPVNTGGLLPVNAANPTAEDVVAAFAKASPATIAAIQHQLVLGGFYNSNYSPNYGLVNSQDIDAFAKATSTAAQTGADLSQYLGRQAKFGEYQGVAAALSNNGKPRTISKADPLALSALIEKEFQALTGRKPNAGERAGFITAYNAVFTASQNANYDSAAAAQAPPVDASGYSTAPQTPFGNFQDTGGAVGGVIGALKAATANVYNAQADQANLAKEPSAPTMPGVATQQDFDPTAFAENYVKQNAGKEVGAHDITSQFSNFLHIIGGIK
jgi:hypothetical protein